MAKYFTGGNLRFVNGEWRDDNGNAIEISRVRHGHWVQKPQMYRHPYAKNYYCSECREETNTCGNYCPNCGAKMDGGAD